MEDLLTMAPADLEALSVDQLLLIQQEITDEATKIKGIVGIYETILSKRYEKSIAEAYKAKDDEYGKATFADGEHIIEIETPKNVKWDNDKMKTAEKKLRDEWEEDPEEYITYTRKVPEATFNAWPGAIKKLFEPARSVKAGKRKISIKQKETE